MAAILSRGDELTKTHNSDSKVPVSAFHHDGPTILNL